MKLPLQSRKYYVSALKRNRNLLLGGLAAFVAIAFLMLFRLRTLLPGISATEAVTALQLVGWHGIYNSAFFLPIKLVRSVVFFIDPNHGVIATRISNTLFGGLSILLFAYITRLWHGARIALFTTLIFACSAWVLHVSRFASFDVMYLWGILMILAIHASLYRYSDKKFVVYGSLMAWGLLLYIPGMVWFILIDVVLQSGLLKAAWKDATIRTKGLYAMSIGIWLPLLLIQLTRPDALRYWIGLPAHFDSVLLTIKHVIGVPVHIFLRGPAYPELWLGRAPVLDAASLIFTVLGIYFYASHHKAGRSRLLGSFALMGLILVALGGAVSLSVLVPLAMLCAAAGMAYLLHDWLKVFPKNPVARTFGVTMIALLVFASCTYNLRAYFIAWPHSITAQTTFRYRL